VQLKNFYFSHPYSASKYEHRTTDIELQGKDHSDNCGCSNNLN